jgi:ribulose-phosphate 3-epimerase
MSKRTEIIPAILPKDFAELEDKIGMVKDFVKMVQIDACDGQFTPSASWPYRKEDDTFEKIIHEEEGLPGWQALNFEIDLMANKPEDLVDDWVIAGATRIVIHAEAKGDVAGAIAKLADRAEIGLALNIDTPLDAIEPHRNAIQFIQLMGIDHIGFQGQGFDEKVLGKVKEAHIKYPALPISVDGGVSLETAQQLIDAGADRLIVGSAIFQSDNFIEAIQNFKRL